MPIPTDAFSGFAFTSAPLDRADALRDDPDAIVRLWQAGRVLVLDEFFVTDIGDAMLLA
ncbi:cell division protein ZapE, partial [Xanthomonas sp. Kuri4-3]